MICLQTVEHCALLGDTECQLEGFVARCYGFCLDASPKSHAAIGVAFSKMTDLEDVMLGLIHSAMVGLWVAHPGYESAALRVSSLDRIEGAETEKGLLFSQAT